MISTKEAFTRILALGKPLTTERLAIEDCHLRVLAAPIAAKRSQPGCPMSAMDGYAVNSADLNENNVVGLELLKSASRAGHPFDLTLTPGQAARIYTGAPVPKGADQVIAQEDVTVNEGQIAVMIAPQPGRHIRDEATDFEERETLLDAGTVLTPKSIGLAASALHSHVMVHRAPKVAIITTGDEILSSEANAVAAHQTVDSVSPMITALLKDAGADIVTNIHVKDNLDAITDCIKRNKSADIIITIGGASVGDHDHLNKALDAAGATKDFWKIAMRPGKPLMAGKLGEAILLGLPGNPVSAFVCSLLFARPLIDHLMGRPAPFPEGVDVPSAVDMPHEGPRDHYRRARLVITDAGPVVDPAMDQDSSLLTVLAACDGLMLRPANSPALEKGGPCRYIPF